MNANRNAAIGTDERAARPYPRQSCVRAPMVGTSRWLVRAAQRMLQKVGRIILNPPRWASFRHATLSGFSLSLRRVRDNAPYLVAVALALSGVLRAEPVRVVSQTVGTDELLLALATPEQVGALSHLAREATFSAVAKSAEAFPHLSATSDAESVLKYSPTLVLCADYSRKELVDQVRRAGIRVIVFDRYATLADAYANLRTLGEAMGPDAAQKAEKLIAACEARVAALREKLRDVKPVRVIAPSVYGVIPGAATTFEDLCVHAGAENLATTLGQLTGHAPPPNEQMLLWPIDRVVIGASDAGDALESELNRLRGLPPYAHMKVIQEKRAVVIAPHLLSSVTHHRVDGYEQLARALHPEVFK